MTESCCRHAVLLMLMACGSSPEIPRGFDNSTLFSDREMIFVRDGVIVQGVAGDGQPLPGDRRLIPQEWEPGESIEVDAFSGQAPQQPECLPLFQLELGDVSRHIAMGGEGPHTGLAWSPSGEQLAIGTYLGELIIVDGWSGEVLSRKTLTESVVKKVQWSPDGSVLYAAEQSPDAYVYALSADSLAPLWTLRLADRVETSPAPAGEDIYGVYQLPAAYGLTVLQDGDILVAATHSWRVQEEALNLTQLLRVSPQGEVLSAWPDTPTSATFLHPRVDEDGDRVSINVNRSADGPAPSDLPIGGVQVLRLSDLEPLWSHSEPPLRPYYTQSFIWDAVDIQGDRLLMGFGDGRIRLIEPETGVRLALNPGTPLVAATVPIAAAINGVLLRSDQVLFSTMSTLIPYGTSTPELRPPTVHPQSNRVTMHNLEGEIEWTWSGPYRHNGLTLGPDEQTLVLGAGPRSSDRRRDLFGALVFDLNAGELNTVCTTEGPVFFKQALTEDGRIAVIEYPGRGEDETIFGEYRLVVFR
jgi:WD40 repeat protein